VRNFIRILVRIALNVKINLKENVFLSIIHLFPSTAPYFIVSVASFRLLIDGCSITGRRGKAMKMMIMSQRNPNMKRYVCSPKVNFNLFFL